MQKFLLAKKIGMTQVFGGEGKMVPVTVVQAAPLTVIQEKTEAKDGYPALQLGFGARKPKNISKPQREAWKGLGSFEVVREGRGLHGKQAGESLDLTQFHEGDLVKVSGISKAKGFQGVVKRHGFHGAPSTHGTKHAHREPGSIGGGGRPGGKVRKGLKMAGRMGGERVSVRKVQVVRIDSTRQLIAIKGAIPGRRGTLVEIRG